MKSAVIILLSLFSLTSIAQNREDFKCAAISRDLKSLLPFAEFQFVSDVDTVIFKSNEIGFLTASLMKEAKYQMTVRFPFHHIFTDSVQVGGDTYFAKMDIWPVDSIKADTTTMLTIFYKGFPFYGDFEINQNEGYILHGLGCTSTMQIEGYNELIIRILRIKNEEGWSQ